MEVCKVYECVRSGLTAGAGSTVSMFISTIKDCETGVAVAPQGTVHLLHSLVAHCRGVGVLVTSQMPPLGLQVVAQEDAGLPTCVDMEWSYIRHNGRDGVKVGLDCSSCVSA
jgi:hypothetical protein